MHLRSYENSQLLKKVCPKGQQRSGTQQGMWRRGIGGQADWEHPLVTQPAHPHASVCALAARQQPAAVLGV